MTTILQKLLGSLPNPLAKSATRASDTNPVAPPGNTPAGRFFF
jgi:hypothetical protein